MTLKIIAWSLLSFIAGFLVCAAVMVGPEYVPLEEQSVAYHWKKIREYRDYMDDPASYTPVPGPAGMVGTSPPFNIEPHLVILEDLGEIEYLDIVLPGISKDCDAATRLWMLSSHEMYMSRKFISGIQATNPGTLDLSGQEPFRVQMWVEKDSVDEMIKLMQDLDEFAREACATSTSGTVQTDSNN